MALASLVDYWSVSFSLGFEKSYGHKSLLLHGAFLDTCNFLLQKCIVAGGRHHMRLFHVTVGPWLTRQWPFCLVCWQSSCQVDLSQMLRIQVLWLVAGHWFVALGKGEQQYLLPPLKLEHHTQQMGDFCWAPVLFWGSQRWHAAGTFTCSCTGWTSHSVWLLSFKIEKLGNLSVFSEGRK